MQLEESSAWLSLDSVVGVVLIEIRNAIWVSGSLLPRVETSN